MRLRLSDNEARNGWVYRIAADRTAWRAVGDKGVVLDLEQSVYFGLNSCAGTLWLLLMRGSTEAELIAAVLSHSPTTPARAGADVSEFLATVGAAGLFDDAAPA